MLKLYKFVTSYNKEVYINPDHVIAVEKHYDNQLCTIHLINNLSYTLKADVDILSEALEVTSNSKRYL